MVDEINIQNEIDGILKPAVNAPQVSPIVPPIQTIQRPEVYSQFQEPTPVNEKSGLLKITIFIFLIIAVVTALYYFRNQLFGSLSYDDCLQIEESTRVDLEPKYCVAPDGKIFFENRKLIPPEVEDIEQTFTQDDGPTTDPPN